MVFIRHDSRRYTPGMSNVIPFKKPGSGAGDPAHTKSKRCQHEWEAIEDEELKSNDQHSVIMYQCKHCGTHKSIVRKKNE